MPSDSSVGQTSSPRSASQDWKSQLDPLFTPRSIAVIGASERVHYVATLVANLRRFGFPDEGIYPINPNHSTVFGLPCYASLHDVPGPVDLAVICVPRDSVVDIVQQCADHRVGAATIISAGFAETDDVGEQLQARMREIAEAHRLPISGPNCVGSADLVAGVAPFASAAPLPECRGSVSVVFQSGGLLNPFLVMAQYRCIGLRRVVSIGNQAVLAAEDFLLHLARDEASRILCGYVEGFRDRKQLVTALETARELEKPVILIKAGRSQTSKRASASHTGTIVTAALAWEALLRQYGATLVEDIDELTETVVLFSQARDIPSSLAVGVFGISGGDSVLVPDLCDRNGLELPELDEFAQARVREIVRKPRLLGNPLDTESRFFGADRDGGFLRAFSAFASSKPFSTVVCSTAGLLSLDLSFNDREAQLSKKVHEIARAEGKLLVVMARASKPWDPRWFRFFADEEVPFLLGFDRGFRALRRLLDYGRFVGRCRALREEGHAAATPPPKERATLPNIAGNCGWRGAAELLSACGVPLARWGLADSPTLALRLAEEIGYPVVLKVDSPDIPHRNRVGAVQVGLRRSEDVLEAFDRILDNAHRAVPSAKIEGIIVQEQVAGILEMMLGIYSDEGVGPLVLLGLGGVFVETLGDLAIGVPPLSREDVHHMLAQLKGSRLLFGESLTEKPDLDKLVDSVLAVSALAQQLEGQRVELDINPLMVLGQGQGVKAVDALLVVNGEGPGRMAPLIA